MIEQPLFLLAAQACSFLIHLIYLKQSVRPQSVRTHTVLYHSLCSICVTYGVPCHSIGHQVPNPCPEKQRISLGVASILNVCLCPNTYLTFHREVLLGRFYLCVRIFYGTLCQPLTRFEPTI